MVRYAANGAGAENLIRAGWAHSIKHRNLAGVEAPAHLGSPVVTARGWPAVLLRLAYLGVTNALALLRLLPMTDRDKDAEILVLRHQITVLERQLHGEKVRFAAADRAFLAALLHRLPRQVLHRLRLLV